MLSTKEQNAMLSKAVDFATRKHLGQFRKDTTIPYIVHPLEVLQILYSMGADSYLLAAGVLHDTVEDTDTAISEIEDIFGKEVARLVASNSEDKSKTWDERKQHTIESLKFADERVKMLIMADKLANLRSMVKDYKSIGNKLWQRFNAPKEKQAWYFNGILDALWDMQNISECEDAYWEFNGLYKDLFVRFFLDMQNGILYQMSITGENYSCFHEECIWKPYDAHNEYSMADCIGFAIEVNESEPKYFKVNTLSDKTIAVTRKEAEFLEDVWRYNIGE